jgi:tetratricopeptide (TPR) repeat protein
MQRWCLVFGLVLVFTTGVGARRKAVAPVASLKPSLELSVNDKQLFDYYFSEAVSARHNNRFDEALDLIRYCLQIDSLNAQAWYESAVFYNNIKHTDWGLEAMEKARSLDPSNEWYAFGLANMYLGLKMNPKAIALYEGLLRTRPSDENLHFQLANLYAQGGRFPDAIREWDKVESLIGKNEQVSLNKFRGYKELNQPRKAIHEVQALADKNPYDAGIRLLVGDCWMELDNPQDAFRLYQEARQMDPDNPAVSLSLADYYNTKGDSLEARKQYLAALTNPNTDVDTKLEIFTPMLQEAFQSADSVRIPDYFRVLLDQHPNEERLRSLYVEYLMAKGMKQAAKDELVTVLDLNPNQLETWKKLLELCTEAGNQKEISRVCKQGLTYFPTEPIFWFYLGLSVYPESPQNGSPDAYREAIRYFQKAIDGSKKDDQIFVSRVYGLIGDARLSLGERSLAYEQYDKALEVYSGNVLVLNNYAYYLSEEGSDLAKAERMSRRTIDADPKNSTFLDTYAWIFFKEEKYSLAKIYMERAIANEPNPSSVLWEHYGDILWFNDEKTSALEQWKKGLKLENPSEELVEKVKTGQYVKPKNKQP